MEKIVERKRAINALSTVAIQTWKARFCFGTVEPIGSAELWDRVIVELYGDYCPLRINKYVGNFLGYCSALYETSCHRAPLVDAIPVICSYGIDTTDRLVDLLRSLGYNKVFTDEWYLWEDLHNSILYMNGVWGKNLKYHVQYLFNRVEAQPHLTRTEFIVGVDGNLFVNRTANRSLLRRIEGCGLRKLEARNTVLQGFKKSLLPLDCRDWRESHEGTMVALQTPPSPMDDIIKYQMSRTGRELKEKAPKKIRILPNYTLSKSACVEKPRTQGGFAYEFLSQQSLWRDDRMDIYYRISPPSLVGHVRYDRYDREHLLYSRCSYSYSDVFDDHSLRNDIEFFTLDQWKKEYMVEEVVQECGDEFAYDSNFDQAEVTLPNWNWKNHHEFNTRSLEKFYRLPCLQSPDLGTSLMKDMRIYRNPLLNPSKLFESLEGGALVQMRTIPEPFKFRSISVGEYEVYSTLMPWQRYMWKNLQKFPCFSLTGEGSDRLVDVVQSIVTKYWDVGMKFLSGDYKDATNKLSSLAARILCRSWFCDKPDLLKVLDQSLFRSTISNEKVHQGIKPLQQVRKYKPCVDEFGQPMTRREVEEACAQDIPGGAWPEEYEMVNGQLMGHPLSFPILCAVNAAICRYALEQAWGRTFSLKDLPLLINGDDCLLIGGNHLQPIWREVTAQCGLIESVGKSYFSDRFAMINSRYLEIDTVPLFPGRDKMNLQDENEIPVRYYGYVRNDVGYINQGILVGRKKGSNVDCEVNVSDKVTDETAFKFWQSAAANFRQMGLRCKKLKPDLGRYVTSFKRFFDKIPLYLHMAREKGGFGFEGTGNRVELSSLNIERNPFKSSLPGSISMGEAYASGGISSVFDSIGVPDFLAEAKRVRNLIDSRIGPIPKSVYDSCLEKFPNLFSNFIKEFPESTWNIHTCTYIRHVGRQPRQGWRGLQL